LVQFYSEQLAIILKQGQTKRLSQPELLLLHEFASSNWTAVRSAELDS
jgi:hypothetical protein